MDALEAIKKLAKLAEDEPAPETDVSESVLGQIRAERGRGEAPVIAPFSVLAVGSAAAAAVVTAFTLHAWIAWNDPMVALFTQLRMVML